MPLSFSRLPRFSRFPRLSRGSRFSRDSRGSRGVEVPFFWFFKKNLVFMVVDWKYSVIFVENNVLLWIML